MFKGSEGSVFDHPIYWKVLIPSPPDHPATQFPWLGTFWLVSIVAKCARSKLVAF